MNLQAEKLELFRLLLDTDNDAVLKKVKTMLKKASSNKNGDDTDYLLSTEANRKHLAEGMKQAKESKTKAISVKDIWK